MLFHRVIVICRVSDIRIRILSILVIVVLKIIPSCNIGVSQYSYLHWMKLNFEFSQAVSISWARNHYTSEKANNRLLSSSLTKDKAEVEVR